MRRRAFWGAEEDIAQCLGPVLQQVPYVLSSPAVGLYTAHCPFVPVPVDCRGEGVLKLDVVRGSEGPWGLDPVENILEPNTRRTNAVEQ